MKYIAIILVFLCSCSKDPLETPTPSVPTNDSINVKYVLYTISNMTSVHYSFRSNGQLTHPTDTVSGNWELNSKSSISDHGKRDYSLYVNTIGNEDTVRAEIWVNDTMRTNGIGNLGSVSLSCQY